MLDSKTKTALLRELPKIYEMNFGRLLHLLPNIHELHGSFTVLLDEVTHLTLDIIEQYQYTTILSLTQQPGRRSTWIPELHMKIRIYHDARCAEVIGYQQSSRFRASYPYPNRDMYQQLEKRQINLFFHDWLQHCLALRRRHRLTLSTSNA